MGKKEQEIQEGEIKTRPYSSLTEEERDFIHHAYTWILEDIKRSDLDNTKIKEHFSRDRGISSELFNTQYSEYQNCRGLKTSCENLISAYMTNTTGVNSLTRPQGELTASRLLIVPGFIEKKALTHCIVWVVETWDKCDGFIIPLRDSSGRIHSLKIRILSNLKKGQGKYVYLSHADGNKYKYTVPTWHFPTLRRSGIDLTIKDFDTVYITEGEIKAHTCNVFLSPQNTRDGKGRYTISIGGIYNYQGVVEELSKYKNIKKVVVVYDQDTWFNPNIHKKIEDVNPHFLKSLIGIHKSLMAIGVECFFLRWNLHNPATRELLKGIDDVLIEKYRYISSQGISLQNAPIDDGLKEHDSSVLCFEKEEIWALRGLPRGIKYIANEGVFINVKSDPTITYKIDTIHADPMMGKDLKSKKDIVEALKDPTFPAYSCKMYFPKPVRSFFDKTGDTLVLNTYIPPNVGYIKPNPNDEDCPVKLWCEHIKYIMPTEGDALMLHWFISSLVKTPWKKIKWAPVIQGGHGIGKSLIGKAVARLVGEDNVTKPESNQLHTHYNGWVQNCVLSFWDEFSGQNKIEFFNSIKTAITEDKITSTVKFKNGEIINNYCNLLLFTNNRGALMIEERERRYAPVFSTATQKEEEYYNKLWGTVILSEEGMGKLNYFYKNYESPVEFSHNFTPITSGIITVKSFSKTELQETLEGLRDNSASFFNEYEVICFSDIARYLSIHHPKMKIHHQHLGIALIEIGGIRVDDLRFGGVTLDGVKIPSQRLTFYIMSNTKYWKEIPESERTGKIRDFIHEKYGKWLAQKCFIKLS